MHSLHSRLLRKLFANPESYRFVACSSEQLARLPGVGVRKADLALVA